MRPPIRKEIDYERIRKYDEWIPGEIEEIKLVENRDTGFKDAVTGEKKFADQIRFKFKLADHNFPHYSRWMGYNFGEKANLYLKYLKYLVEGAQPDMDFDLDLLKGFKVKTMWSENGEYDNLDQIRAFGTKFKNGVKPEPSEEELADEVGEEIRDDEA